MAIFRWWQLKYFFKVSPTSLGEIRSNLTITFFRWVGETPPTSNIFSGSNSPFRRISPRIQSFSGGFGPTPIFVGFAKPPQQISQLFRIFGPLFRGFGRGKKHHPLQNWIKGAHLPIRTPSFCLPKNLPSKTPELRSRGRNARSWDTQNL